MTLGMARTLELHYETVRGPDPSSCRRDALRCAYGSWADSSPVRLPTRTATGRPARPIRAGCAPPARPTVPRSLPNSDGLCRSRRGRASTQSFPRGGRPDQTEMSMIRRSLRCAGGRSVTGSARWTSGSSVRFRHTAGRTAKRHMQGALSPLDRPLGRATRRRSQVRTEPSLVG